MKKLVVLAASVAGLVALRARRRSTAAHDAAVWHEAVTEPGTVSRPSAGAPKAP